MRTLQEAAQSAWNVNEQEYDSWLEQRTGTDEWPVNGQRHQLSITVPLQNSPVGRGAALGDVALNYRLQLAGSGDTRFAMTPRLTLLLPTASSELGGATFGVQPALASSVVVTDKLVTHTNAGFTVWPSVDAGGGAHAQLLDLTAGQSAVIAPIDQTMPAPAGASRAVIRTCDPPVRVV